MFALLARCTFSGIGSGVMPTKHCLRILAPLGRKLNKIVTRPRKTPKLVSYDKRRGGQESYLTPPLVIPPPPPLAIPPPERERSLGPKSIENTRCQRKFLQGAERTEADLHCDTMVQFGGATPPPPRGESSLRDRPPPRGGNHHDIGGQITRGGGRYRVPHAACRLFLPICDFGIRECDVLLY